MIKYVYGESEEAGGKTEADFFEWLRSVTIYVGNDTSAFFVEGGGFVCACSLEQDEVQQERLRKAVENLRVCGDDFCRLLAEQNIYFGTGSDPIEAMADLVQTLRTRLYRMKGQYQINTDWRRHGFSGVTEACLQD